MKRTSTQELTPAQLNRIKENVHDFLSETARDPGFRKEAMEKLAIFNIDKKETGNVLGATAAAIAAAAVANDAYDYGKNALLRAYRYKKMLDENPELQKADRKVVQRTFNTLHRFNPGYAADPMVAGSFVRQAMESEGLDLATMKNLVESARSLPSKPSTLSMVVSPQTLTGSLRFAQPEKSKEEVDAETLRRRAAMYRDWQELRRLHVDPLGKYKGQP